MGQEMVKVKTSLDDSAGALKNLWNRSDRCRYISIFFAKEIKNVQT
jgi:hypothetical protein